MAPKTNNHTPGEWTIEEYDGECWWIESRIVAPGDNTIAYMNDTCAEGDPDLISASPDLLKALEAVEWVNGPEQCPDSYCPWCENMESEGHAADCLRDQAIKNARGEK